ncbi:very short patch repair endonuclease, partial [Escherichia coli]
MMDNISKEERHRVMASVKQKNTRPELKVRYFLHSQGLRYRLHDRFLPGKPDIILPKYRTIIFVNGCFWHGHEDDNCK